MKPGPETRYSLIEKIRSPEDADAWAEFTAIYQPIVFEICRSKGMQFADANDVTQEVLARVATAIEKFDRGHERATFRGWLYRVTRNLVIDFFRARDKDLLVKAVPDLEDLLRLEPPPEESMQFDLSFRRQMFVVVAKQVQANSVGRTWDAFWKTEIEQLPVVTVAQELGMTTGAIYVARSRILARMRTEVQKRLSETTDSMPETGSF